MSQLKRKSVGGSPGPNENGGGDAPSKRVKVDDIPGASPGAEDKDTAHRDGDVADKNGVEQHETSPVRDAFLKQQSTSPDARRPSKAVTISSSPERERRPSESGRRRDSSPRDRIPDRDRRRSRSPAMRFPDHDRQRFDSGRRDRSLPARRDRRESETSRREAPAAFGENDRNRRQNPSSEEKKRGKRLFGGLLSTLSQRTTNSQQKRRQEIEKKQQEKAAKQKIEDDKRRSQKLEKLDRIRKTEQVRFNEQVMRTRHSNMLAMSHSLQTRTEPKLYFRPWELTKEQEDIIRNQIRDAEVQIEDELQQFKRRKEQRLGDLGALSSTSRVDAIAGEPVEDLSNTAAQDESAITATNDPKRSPSPAHAPERAGHEDKDHGEMIEAEEDTVIY